MSNGEDAEAVGRGDGRAAAHLRGALDGVNSVAFSPDGARVLSGSDDSTLKLWDAATGELLRTFEGHSEPGRLSCVLARRHPRVVGQRGQDGEAVGHGDGRAVLRTFEGHQSGHFGCVLARWHAGAVGQLPTRQ